MKDLFFAGTSYADYVAKMGEDDRAGFVKSYNQVLVTEKALTRLQALPKPIYALAVSEPWCGDCRINLPVLARLVEASLGKIELRCVSRDAFPTLLDAYPAPDGTQRIPTFIFFDADWICKGYFVERPAQVTHILATGSAEEKRAMRIQYNAGAFATEVADELLALLTA